jgi:flagellar motor switch protein FliN/FliY
MNERAAGLQALLDVPLTLSVELGRSTMRMREIAELGTGSIVALEREAGAPVDVLVNGKAVARGEIIAIDDRYGVRITELRS